MLPICKKAKSKEIANLPSHL
ncbi:hypothetical protein EUTSA_v100276521mg, partial [Eutrema salsugineum]